MSIPSAPPPRATAATVDACRGHATDEDLGRFWKVATGGGTGGVADSSAISLGFLSVFKLRIVDPGVDPTVAAAMKAAAQRSTELREQWVSTGDLDVMAFSQMLTPFMEACQNAGIDMAMPG